MYKSYIPIEFHDKNAVKEACGILGIEFVDFCVAYTIALSKGRYKVNKYKNKTSIKLVFKKIDQGMSK